MKFEGACISLPALPRNGVGDRAGKQGQYQESSGGHCPSRRRLVPQGLNEEGNEAHGERQQGNVRKRRRHYQHYSGQACSPFEGVSGRSHSETWAGCIVSATTPTRSSLRASRSVSSRKRAEKALRVFAASYFLR